MTLFPDMFEGPFNQSIIHRAIEKKIASIEYIDLRNYAADKYKSVDDHPYGGGHGMILRVDVIDHAIIDIKRRFHEKAHAILLDPQGITYSQSKAKELSRKNHIILICGHYETFDERVRNLVDEEISIGDYIVTGGEIPAMAVVDSVIRLLPNALSKTQATNDESFSKPVLEYPQYTRPLVYENRKVPAILLSGDHKKIDSWRQTQALARTKKRRPDLLKG